MAPPEKGVQGTSEARGQVVRTGAVTAVALTVVVALLQGLQGVVSSFNPSWAVTALLALAGIGASLVVQRLAARRSEAQADRERRALLRASLRTWPLAPLADVSDDALGVFPRRRSLGDAPYAERDLDRQLGAALSEAPPVVVIGRARAGKSRTASTVAGRTFQQRMAVIPRDAEALRTVLGVEPPLEFGEAGGVLWLDGLERYLEALDGETLDELTGAGLRIVATIRDGTWTTLLAGEGREAAAAKALAARARVFELPASLSSAECSAARRLYPGEDLSRGIGAVVASNGRETLTPPAAREHRKDSEREAPRRPVPAARDGLLLVPAVIGSLALAAVGLLALTGNFEKPKPPTIAEQAQDARRAGSAGPREVVDAERVDFHGSGERSYFFAFGDADGVPPTRARSDELQVFDQRGDDLDRAFRFEPSPLESGASREQLLFQFRFIGDIDGDGADELVGGYGTPAIPGELLVPFAVDWDEDAGSYRLVSLAREPASLETRGRGDDVRGLRDAYERRLRLTDMKQEKLRFAGFPAQDFTVAPDPHRLVAGYVSELRKGGAERRVELQPSTFQRTGGRPRVTQCRLGSRPLTVKAPRGKARPLYAVTLEAWLKASKDRFCIPVG
jgi:hypothetical protein